MKIYLAINKQELNGYLNLDPSKEQVVVQKICEDAEATEIILDEFLNYVPLNKLEYTLLKVVKKLRHGGTLTIIFVDLNLLNKFYYAGRISEEDFNNVIFGGKTCIYTINTILSILNRHNIKIINKQISQLNTIIKVRRQ